jgi:hypothetical protein
MQSRFGMARRLWSKSLKIPWALRNWLVCPETKGLARVLTVVRDLQILEGPRYCICSPDSGWLADSDRSLSRSRGPYATDWFAPRQRASSVFKQSLAHWKILGVAVYCIRQFQYCWGRRGSWSSLKSPVAFEYIRISVGPDQRNGVYPET